MGGSGKKPSLEPVVGVRVGGSIVEWSVHIGLAVVYLTFLGLCIGALVALFAQQPGSIAFGIIAGVVAAVGHFLVVVLGISLIDGYVMYPVYPRLLYVLADAGTGVAAGLILGDAGTDSNGMLILTNLALALAMALQLWRVAAVAFGWFLYDKVKKVDWGT